MVGIYIHIPFCISKCGYCDFFSIPVGNGGVPHDEYLKAMLRQLDKDAREFGLAGRKIETIYFGGGTPSLMPPSFFERVINELSKIFLLDRDAEIASELNPATVKNMSDLKNAGVNRVSIGVQSFNTILLGTLGRIHSSEEAMSAIAKAQDAGLKSVNVDLMFAIPGETAAILEDDLRTVMTFQPEHISAYQLTIEKGTPFYAHKIINERRTTNDERRIEDEQLKQMRIVARMLERGGWKRYEISNYAKPGFECRHNLNYWQYGEYLGIGAGATSFIKGGQGSRVKGQVGPSSPCYLTISPSHYLTVFGLRFTQIRDVERYIKGNTDAELEEIDDKTAMGEFSFMGLRTMDGISKLRFEDVFGVAFDTVYGKICALLKDEGLVVEKNDNITLSARGIELSNQVFERFV